MRKIKTYRQFNEEINWKTGIAGTALAAGLIYKGLGGDISFQKDPTQQEIFYTRNNIINKIDNYEKEICRDIDIEIANSEYDELENTKRNNILLSNADDKIKSLSLIENPSLEEKIELEEYRRRKDEYLNNNRETLVRVMGEQDKMINSLNNQLGQ